MKKIKFKIKSPTAFINLKNLNTLNLAITTLLIILTKLKNLNTLNSLKLAI